MTKRVLAIILAAVVVLGLVACGSKKESGSGSATPSEKILSVQIGPDPETIDPALNSAVDGGNMILHLFECLLIVDEDGALQPGQAESYDVSEDGLTWTFHLRKDLKWSDGSALTAKDFVYSWKRVCDPVTAAPYAETVLGMVVGYAEAAAGNLDALGVEAKDDQTLVVHLATPCGYFGSLAAFATLSPVQQATVEANGDAWAVSAETFITNGAFYIKEWVPGSHILVAKNPNYRDADSVKLDGIKFNLIEDANASYSAYQSGEVLMIKDVPTEEIPSLQGQADFHIDPILGTYYISMNTSVAPFDNAKIRQALSLAIDRDYVANTLMQGTYSPAYSFMGPGWNIGGTEFKEKDYISADYEANLAQAKKLLEEAGYPNGQGLPQLTYSTNDSGYHKVVAEYLQQAWAELGIDLKVDIVEWSSFTPMRRNGDYQIARNGWVGDYSDPSNMIELLYSSNGNNDGKYNNPAFDAAIDASRATVDPDVRRTALHQAEDILMEDAACIPVAYYNDFYLMSEKITGAWHSPYGYWFFMYADIQ